MMKRLTVASLIAFISVMLIGIDDLHADVIIVTMTKAEKTGRSKGGNPGEGFEGVPLNYEIKIEWEISHSPNPNLTSNLYRRNSPGAYPNGNIISYNVQKYDDDGGHWDELCSCTLYTLYFRYYDWPLAGTWYYMAYEAINEVSETVP